MPAEIVQVRIATEKKCFGCQETAALYFFARRGPFYPKYELKIEMKLKTWR